MSVVLMHGKASGGYYFRGRFLAELLPFLAR